MEKQKGMTVIGMLFTVVVVVMAGICVMRIIPVYLQHYSIVQSVKSLNTTPAASLSGDPLTDVGVLRRSLTKRFDVNGIEDLKEDQVIITPAGTNRYTVKIKYQVVKPLVYNMSILFDFENVEEVQAGSEK